MNHQNTILQEVQYQRQDKSQQIQNRREQQQKNQQSQQQIVSAQQKMMNEQTKANLPFTIELFNKEDRQRERSNKPKLGIRRLTQDKKLVSIDIDIPVIDQYTILKEKFDWDLSKEKISPLQFSRELVSTMGLPVEYIDKIKNQILGQIMEHIKANTHQKPQQQAIQLQDQTFNRNFQAIRFNNNEYPQQQLQKQENQKKKMSRMRRKELQRTTIMNASQPNRYFKEKKICRNCKNQNITPGFQCRICKFPFQLMELLNMDDKRIKISVKYYEKIANKIPLLVYQAKKRHFEKQDFDSFYLIYNKIRSIFEGCDQLSKQNLNQVKYIMEKYHEYFLNGQLDFNDEEIIYEKDTKKDLKQDENRPKRQRGRPRKIKIINDDLLPGSSDNQDDSSSSDSSDSYQSSDSE